MIFIIGFVFFFGLAIWASMAISNLAYNAWRKNSVKNADFYRVLTFILSLAIILVAAFFLLISNFRLQR